MKLLKLIAIVLIVVWSIGPIVLGITTSISTQREVNSVPTHWVPHSPTLQAYRALLNGSTGQTSGGTVVQGGDFVHAMTNSAVIALGAAALTLTMNAKPVTVLITEYVGKYTTNYPILAAAGVLALIPPAILALVLNKRITGMLAGSS